MLTGRQKAARKNIPDIEVFVLAGRGVNRVLKEWFSIVFKPSQVHFFDPAKEIPDQTGEHYIVTTTAARNEIARRFLETTDRPWLVTFDDDVYPAPETLEMLASDEPSVQEDDGNFYLKIGRSTYPPGFNIIADLEVPISGASARVSTAAGRTVTMIAKDADGNVLHTAVSPVVQKYREFVVIPEFRVDTPITSLEWWPSDERSSVMIDDLSLLAIPQDADSDEDDADDDDDEEDEEDDDADDDDDDDDDADDDDDDEEDSL